MKNLVSQRLSWNRNASSSATGCMRLAGLLAAAVSASYVPTVAAQGNNLMLEEIVVTVRRRVEMEQDVPISLKSLDTDYLRQQNITELSDLGRKIPAVSITTAGTSTNQPIITVRGQRPTDTTLSLDQAVPIYFNEVVMTPSQGTNLSMYDLQSVQVLKGPQGTLFGRNSTGGAFIITPTRPGVDFGGYAEVKVGNYNLVAVEGAVDLPVNDTVQFRVAGQKTEHDGYQENVADNAIKGAEFWDENSKGMRVTMNLDVGDLSNLFTVAYDENDMAARMSVPNAFLPSGLGAIYAGPFGYGLANIEAAIERQNSRDVTDIETDMSARDSVENTFASNITEFEINDQLSFKSVLGYRKLEAINSNNADGTALPIFGALTSRDSLVTTDPEPNSITESEQYSVELQLLGDALDGALEWISGVYWYKMDGSQSGVSQFAGPNVVNAGLGFPFFNEAQGTSAAGDVNNEALGLFGEGTYTFTDQWSLTFGARYSYDERSMTVKNMAQPPTPFDPDGPGGPAPIMTVGPIGVVGRPLECTVRDESGNVLPTDACARTVSDEFEAPTWRTSLNFTPMEGMLTYASISTGYRSGGFNLRGVSNDSLQPFDEETVVTYELGYKADWGLAGFAPVRTNLAVYHQDYKDIQKTQSILDGGSFVTTTVNAGEAVIQGVEFDVTAALTEGLVVTLAYAFTDAGYNEWTDPSGNDLSNNDFEWLPKHTASASATYILPLDLSLGEISATLGVYWQDKMTTVAAADQFGVNEGALAALTGDNLAEAESTKWTGSYDIWNFRLDWRGVLESNFDAALWVDNLTDEEYAVGGFNQVKALGFSQIVYGEPRTFGATVRYNF